MSLAREQALAAIAARAAAGNPLQLWLRDDDAVRPTPALEHLLELTGQAGVPLTLAVIPSPWDQPPTGIELVERLDLALHVHVAVHGWSHRDQSAPPAKKQELAPGRPLGEMHDQLRAGRERLQQLHGERAIPLLVPPWNRIAADLLPGLAADGFTALSTFGREVPMPGLVMLNTHIDIINWKAGRIGRPADEVWADLLALSDADYPLGVLTHHLVHDETAWAVLHDLIAASRQAGALWQGSGRLIAPR